MADLNHRIVIHAKDRSSAGIGKARRGIESISRSLERLQRYSGIGLLGIFGAQGIRNAVRAAKTQQQAIASMEATLQSMGRTSRGLSGELQALAAQIQREGIIGDEAIIQGQAMLVTYGEITDNLLPRTTRVMADLAAKTGGDVVSAANLLGKASLGLTSELTRVGITLSEETKKSKDFELILRDIETQVGGVNRALAATDTGRLDQMANTLGDIQEFAGGALARAIVAVADNLDVVAKVSVALAAAWAGHHVPSMLSSFRLIRQGQERIKLGFAGWATAIAAGTGAITGILALLDKRLERRVAEAMAPEDRNRLIQGAATRVNKLRAAIDQLERGRGGFGLRRRLEEEFQTADPDELRKLVEKNRATIRALQQPPDRGGEKTPNTPAATSNPNQGLLDQAERLETSLQKQIALYGQTGTAASIRYELERGALSGLGSAHRARIEGLASELAALEGAEAAEEQRADKIERALSIQAEFDQRRAEALDTYRQAQISLRDELASLEGPYAQATLAADRWRESMLAAVVDGAAGAEQFRGQVEAAHEQMLVEAREAESQRLAEAADKALLESDRAIDGLHAGLASYAAQAQTAAQQVQGAFETAWQGAERSLADALASGEVRLSTFADAAKRYLSQALSHQLLSQFASFGLGFFGIGNAVGAGAFAGRGAGVNAANAVPGLAGLAHSGGLAGELGRMRPVGLHHFVEAARYHRGGIVSPFKPGEVPAILRRGEEVLPRDDARHRHNAGAPSVTVNVNNAGTPQRVAEQQARFDGARWVIDIVVEDVDKNGRGIQTIMRALGRGRKDF